jgi:tRNA (guanine37-N1)-methyltransferase
MVHYESIMRFDVLTIFPEFFSSPLRQGIIGRAVSRGIIEVNAVNIRDFATDRHRTTDDYPYGGGAGMVMKVEPLVAALEHVAGAAGRRPTVALATPQGVRLNHSMAEDLASLGHVAIICGRYEGVDERIMGFVDMEISVGDYVLTGGEAAALVMIDAVGRLVPGVVGADESKEKDSFAGALLDYPQYTRPEEFRGLKVPGVLLSGNHAEIERWRQEQSLARTLERRPDLLNRLLKNS